MKGPSFSECNKLQRIYMSDNKLQNTEEEEKKWNVGKFFLNVSDFGIKTLQDSGSNWS